MVVKVLHHHHLNLMESYYSDPVKLEYLHVVLPSRSAVGLILCIGEQNDGGGAFLTDSVTLTTILSPVVLQ